MPIRMLVRLAAILLAILATVNSQPRPGYVNSGSAQTLGDKPDHVNVHFVSEEAPVFSSRPLYANCPIEGNGDPLPRESQGKDTFGKLPNFQLENPHYVEERLFLPMGGLRSKKAQKAILLDVGDYVIKSNGSPMVDAGASSRAVGGSMGGILRSSG